MTVEELISSIADVGILVCIAALFLYACFRAIKSYFDKKDKEIKSKEKEGNIVPPKPEREAHDKAMSIRYQVSEEIQKLLETYQAKWHADRIQVIEFGNSQINLGYLPFRYMSCTYEVCKLGVRGIGSKIDKLSTSLFTPFFVDLTEKGWCAYDIEDSECHVPGAMHDLMIEFEEPRSLNAAIVTASGKFLGYITVKNLMKYTQNDVDDLLTLADQIAALLGILDK